MIQVKIISNSLLFDLEYLDEKGLTNHVYTNELDGFSFDNHTSLIKNLAFVFDYKDRLFKNKTDELGKLNEIAQS